jgi:predicted DNA-binding mobile mystery protein A
MKPKYQKIKIRQLDEKFNSRINIKDIIVPAEGWIKEIRTALSMTYKQLAKRLKVSAPSIANYEKSERMGTINLNTLKKAAEAMNCKLVYSLVPAESLEKVLEDQTLKVAGSIFKKATHSMNLERQDVNEKENVNQYKELIDEINTNLKKKIWDYEL